jgi:hypothetical protein
MFVLHLVSTIFLSAGDVAGGTLMFSAALKSISHSCTVMARKVTPVEIS